MKKMIIRMGILAMFALGTILLAKNYSYAHVCDGCSTHGGDKYCITCANGQKDCTSDSGHPRCSPAF